MVNGRSRICRRLERRHDPITDTLNALFSCAVDTEIVLWDIGTWEKKWLVGLRPIGDQCSTRQGPQSLPCNTRDSTCYLRTLCRVKQWKIADFCTRISHASYSCDSEFVYAVMRDGILIILGASDLGPSAYPPSHLSSYVVVAAHPDKPGQFALGMSNGEVIVIEPLGYDEGNGLPHHNPVTDGYKVLRTTNRRQRLL